MDEIFSNMDVRGYINVFPPGAPTEAGQKHWMTQDVAEIYVEDRKRRQIDALIASVRKGSVVAVMELYLLAPAAFRTPKRRRLLAERIEAIRDRGGDVLELATGYKASRRLPTMMNRAHEQIASSGRARKHNRPGAPLKWVLTPAEREVMAGIWANRMLKNDAERTLAIQHRIGKPITRAWLRRAFGSPHGR